jgi:O-antigen/teichoic acid export membrane protein
MAPAPRGGPTTGGRFSGLLAQHGRAVVEIAIVSGLGIVAAAGIQVVATRGLGPQAFGLLASFLALLNVAALGSAALRNSVAVNAVSAPATEEPPKRRADSSLVEALVLGGLCAVAVLVAAPTLASSTQSSIVAPLIIAVTMIPYFLLARSLGLLQGQRRTSAVVWWSTGSQIAQLAFVSVVLWMGFGVLAVLAAHLLVTILVTVGSGFDARALRAAVGTRPFSATSTVVLLLTIGFAWLTNIDVVLVRSGTPELAGGSYAAAAVLVKITLILPTTLSLYLLPRFASNKANAAMSKLGVSISVGVAALGGLVVLAAFALAARPIVTLLFGSAYGGAADLLPLMALTWIPWAMTQAVLIRIIALASRTGLLVLALAAVLQQIGARLVLPNITEMVVLNGLIGVMTLASLYLIHVKTSRGAKGGEAELQGH